MLNKKIPLSMPKSYMKDFEGFTSEDLQNICNRIMKLAEELFFRV